MLIQNNKIVTEKKDLAERFINYYRKVAEKSSGIKPVNVAMLTEVSDNDTAINIIIEIYKD